METDRTLERLTAPDYLDGLDGADTARIRALRDECRAEERRLSYVRRMVQGHLALATGQLDHRGGGHGDALVAHIDRLRRRERVLSDRRALLLGHLDRLQATPVERHRDGLAAVEDVALRGLDHR